MIFLGETGLLPDLRELNPGRLSGQYDLIFEKLGEKIEEYTAADDRRPNISHMSEILTIKNLINQTKERCPHDTLIPSAALVRLQFCPRNPYSHASDQKFQFNIKFKDVNYVFLTLTTITAMLYLDVKNH